MILKLFSPIYFIMIFLAIILLVFFSIWLKNKSQKFTKIVISIIFFSSFIMHFLKLVFPPYNTDPLAFRKVTAENICALSTLTFPFIFLLAKSLVLKDYMFYFGVMSGVVALLFPIEQLNNDFFRFETIRFYFAHIVLIIGPYLMVYTNHHQLNYRRIYKVPLVFFAVLGIIVVNEVILTEIGLVPLRGSDLFDPKGYRNFSMIFGVVPELGFTEEFLRLLTPKVFLKIPFGEYAGRDKYWPLIWLVVPTYILIPPLCFLLSWPWEKEHIKQDFKHLVNKINNQIILFKEEK